MDVRQSGARTPDRLWIRSRRQLLDVFSLTRSHHRRVTGPPAASLRFVFRRHRIRATEKKKTERGSERGDSDHASLGRASFRKLTVNDLRLAWLVTRARYGRPPVEKSYSLFLSSLEIFPPLALHVARFSESVSAVRASSEERVEPWVREGGRRLKWRGMTKLIRVDYAFVRNWKNWESVEVCNM